MTTDSSHLRREALNNRRRMTAESRAAASATICDRVVRSREFRTARNVACYLPMADEVDTRPIIARAWRTNKRIFVPVVLAPGEMLFREIQPDSVLVRNRYSIWEPAEGALIEPRKFDLVITPVAAFDNENHRVGMGGGYYDRCFTFLKHRKSWLPVKLFGVAFGCQQVEKITPSAWDIPLYRIISEQD